MNTNSVNHLPTMKCGGCGSDAGLVAVKAEQVIRRHFNDRHAVVILFSCKHCESGDSFHVTYNYGPDGVLVTKGHPDGDYAKSRSLQPRPLLCSQVEAIKNGMNWPAPASGYVQIRHVEDWANKFGASLQNTKAEEVPPKIVSVDIVKQGTGRVLRCNVEMKFEINKLLSNDDVTVTKMAEEALEQARLEGFELCRIVQRKELANSIEFVEANVNSKIQHGAFYKVLVRKQQ